MTDCTHCRPILVRVAEGDAGPDEALAVARHLSDCTTCRILLAREVRLEAALESLEDTVHVDDGFLHSVMDALPSAPWKSRRKRRSRLTLVGGGLAIVFVVLAAGVASVPWPSDPRAPGFPGLDFLPLDRVVEIVGAAALWARLSVERLGGLSALRLPGLRSLLPGIAVAAAGLAAVCVGFSVLLVALGTGRFRPSPPRG